MKMENTGVVYGAPTISRILGLSCVCNDPVPQSAYDEIVVYYGGWDLKQLRLSKAGINRMWQEQNWYDDKGWKAEPGYYRVNLRVPSSHGKNWSEQVAHLRTIDEVTQVAPVTVAATALLIHLTETGNDLLENNWCRCTETPSDGEHATLAVYNGRVSVDYCRSDGTRGKIWLASSLLVAPRTS